MGSMSMNSESDINDVSATVPATATSRRPHKVLYTERNLIMAVEKYPRLWDTENASHKSRATQDKLWCEVAKSFSTHVDGAQCLMDWKRMCRSRSAAKRRLGKQAVPRSGSGAQEAAEQSKSKGSAAKPYKHEPLMKFLDRNQNIGETMNNLSVIIENQNDSENGNSVLNFNQNEGQNQNHMRQNCCADVANAFEEAVERRPVLRTSSPLRSAPNPVQDENQGFTSPILGQAPVRVPRRRPLIPLTRNIERPHENQCDPQIQPGVSSRVSPDRIVDENFGDEQLFHRNASWISSIGSPGSPSRPVRRRSSNSRGGAARRIVSDVRTRRNRQVVSPVADVLNSINNSNNESLEAHEGGNDNNFNNQHMTARERADAVKAARAQELADRRQARLDRMRQRIQETARRERQRREENEQRRIQNLQEQQRRARERIGPNMQDQQQHGGEHGGQHEGQQQRRNGRNDANQEVNWIDLAILDEVRGLREDDQFTHFCLSLAPRMRALPPLSSANAQLEILQILLRAETEAQ